MDRDHLAPRKGEEYPNERLPTPSHQFYYSANKWRSWDEMRSYTKGSVRKVQPPRPTSRVKGHQREEECWKTRGWKRGEGEQLPRGQPAR